jgi:hypothetical protein
MKAINFYGRSLNSAGIHGFGSHILLLLKANTERMSYPQKKEKASCYIILVWGRGHAPLFKIQRDRVYIFHYMKKMIRLYGGS